MEKSAAQVAKYQVNRIWPYDFKFYPHAKFIFFHITYPYQDEVIALAKTGFSLALNKFFSERWLQHRQADYVRQRILRDLSTAVNKLNVFKSDQTVI